MVLLGNLFCQPIVHLIRDKPTSCGSCVGFVSSFLLSIWFVLPLRSINLISSSHPANESGLVHVWCTVTPPPQSCPDHGQMAATIKQACCSDQTTNCDVSLANRLLANVSATLRGQRTATVKPIWCGFPLQKCFLCPPALRNVLLVVRRPHRPKNSCDVIGNLNHWVCVGVSIKHLVNLEGKVFAPEGVVKKSELRVLVSQSTLDLPRLATICNRGLCPVFSACSRGAKHVLIRNVLRLWVQRLPSAVLLGFPSIKHHWFAKHSCPTLCQPQNVHYKNTIVFLGWCRVFCFAVFLKQSFFGGCAFKLQTQCANKNSMQGESRKMFISFCFVLVAGFPLRNLTMFLRTTKRNFR